MELRRRLPLLGALLLLALAAAGCGTGGPAKTGDPARGRDLFLKVPKGQKYACAIGSQDQFELSKSLKMIRASR